MADNQQYGSETAAGSNAEYDELIHELQNRRDYWRNRRATREHFANEEKAVNYIQGAGKFVIPRENTWAAHRMLVLDPAMNLGYSPSAYPFFDQRIRQRIDYAPLVDMSDRRYPAYDVLRENIAIVRNYVMSEFFPDGSVDPEDQKQVRQMAQVADFLGEGLGNNGWLRNPLKPKISLERANMPGTGAQYLYQQIKAHETYYNWMMPVLLPLYLVTGKTYKNWGLPSLEDSPFSNDALRVPPPLPVSKLTDEELLSLCSDMDKGKTAQNVSAAYAEGINQIGDSLTHASHMYQSVDSLKEPTKRESVELAKEILRKLKLKIGEALVSHGLSPEALQNFTILESLKGVVQVYEYHLQKLSTQDPRILENPAVRQAADAIGKLGFVAKMEALRIAESSHNAPLAKALTEELLQLPAHWQHPKELKFKELLNQVESGLDAVLLRMAQLGDHDPVSQAWRGFDKNQSTQMTDASIARAADSADQALQNDAYFREFNAQRQAAQQQQANLQSVTARNLQANGMGQSPQGQNTTAGRAPGQNAAPKLGNLIDDKQIATLRDSMKTDPNTAAVRVAQQQQRQAVINRERARREQAERQAKMKAIENANRASQREDKQAAQRDDKTPDKELIEPPLTNPNKKPSSRGL